MNLNGRKKHEGERGGIRDIKSETKKKHCNDDEWVRKSDDEVRFIYKSVCIKNTSPVSSMVNPRCVSMQVRRAKEKKLAGEQEGLKRADGKRIH